MCFIYSVVTALRCETTGDPTMNTASLGLEKVAYTPNELITLGIVGSRTSLYRFVQEGRLRLTKQGKRSIFLAPHVAEFLGSLNGSPTSKTA